MVKKINGTLVLLTLNEIQGTQVLFDKIPFNKVKQAFVIDGGSTDGTREFFNGKGILVIGQKKKGRGEAFRIAIKHARYENVVFFSPDGNEDPRDIIKIFNYLKQGYDLVIASRFMKEARSDDANQFIRYRSLGNQIFTKIVNLIWDGELTDSINGYRGIKKSKFIKVNPDEGRFAIEFQISIRALKKGFRIKEFPTIERERIGGKSTAGTIPTGWRLIRVIIKELLK